MSEAIVHVEIFDTTLRDGAQSLPENNQFPVGSKASIAKQIAHLGIGVIEAGFPRTPGDAEEVSEIAKSVGNNVYFVSQWRNGEFVKNAEYTPVIAGLCRTTEEDIDAAWEAVEYAVYPRIHTFISTDPEHMAAKFEGKSPDQVLAMGQAAVRYAKKLSSANSGASVEFSAEAATTTDEGYLERVIKTAIEEGADVVNLPDTVGQRDPFWMYDFYSKAFGWVEAVNPEVVVSSHNHNDIDMATANSLSLVKAAAAHTEITGRDVNIQIESTICGLGERAGNTDVFPLVAGMFKFSDQYDANIEWAFNRNSSFVVARRVLGQAGIEVHRQSPVVGSDTNVHRSGIHSDGVVKGGHRIYTALDPTAWGHGRDAEHQEGRYQGASGRKHITS